MLKSSPQFVRLVCALVLLAPLSAAQETQVSREGAGWGQEITGTLAGVKNLRVKVDMGSVAVHGGQGEGIGYAVHTRSNASSEEDARRQLADFKVSAYVRGDTAWIVGEWQGGRARRFSGEFAVNVPREMSLVKIET